MNCTHTYCYKTSDGEIHERPFARGEAPETIRIDGKVARRDYRSERIGVPSTAGWPMAPCVASGVNAGQAEELREYFKKNGCPTEVSPDGDPIYRDKAHRVKALKLRGFCDRAS